MFDGKCVNQCCYRYIKFTLTCICTATLREMNNIDKIKNNPVDPNALKIGCSILHYRIISFAILLHIADIN